MRATHRDKRLDRVVLRFLVESTRADNDNYNSPYVKMVMLFEYYGTFLRQKLLQKRSWQWDCKGCGLQKELPN